MTGQLEIPSLKGKTSEAEWKARVDLAAAYRLVALQGWDDLVFSHISARVPGEPGHFLINPYGMMFEEITASSLVKIDEKGLPIGSTQFPVNPAGFQIHSAVHLARPDVQCVLHTHALYGVAVSVQSQGLLPISQASTFPLAGLSYHAYEGPALHDDEKPRLAADLGKNNFLILRNHGLLTCGATTAEAFVFMYALEMACRIQILAQSGNCELLPVNKRIIEGLAKSIDEVTKGLGAHLIWPGLLRRLDRMDVSYKE
jgi:ribulose-5-phosphate 4-epimerase/fuculose-1-phosphate aldolase